jgi:argininosuccinate synthase
MNWVTRYTKVSTILGEDKKNYHAGLLFLVSLDKLMKEKNELHNKNERLQMQVSKLKVSEYALEENLLGSSHKAEVAENQTEALIIRLAELQQKFKSELQRVSAFKVRALIGNKWDPITWDGDMWETPVEVENYESSDY